MTVAHPSVDPDDLKSRLVACPLGQIGWADFEDICEEILIFLFVPPLKNPKPQSRTEGNHTRRDLIFPNLNISGNSLWAKLRIDYDAKYIFFEFKNYNTTNIAKEQVEQLSGYIKPNMGRFGILICSKEPIKSAYDERKIRYSQSNLHQLILFVTKAELIEMIEMKQDGRNPEDLLEDKVETIELSIETF